MKKFDELKKLAEKAPTVVYDMETESGRFYNAANPQTILDLLADREQLREALKFYSQESKYDKEKDEWALNPNQEKIRIGCLKYSDDGKRARYALKKSDEVEV